MTISPVSGFEKPTCNTASMPRAVAAARSRAASIPRWYGSRSARS
ncbi:hypothetical protein [Streptomyces thermolilacinus]